ncbi:MAG: hypothetical protein LBP50_02500 [Tannerella sp.]|jgi:hypothetical protein|nr:hypothetical protein [Tannerella sp.]
MKRIFTAVFLAGAVLSLACISVPAAGQEKVVMKAAGVENIPVRRVEIRADEASPDSAIVYSPTGEKTAKHVYLPGKSYGKYTWENKAWKFSDTIPNTGYFSGARYDRDEFNALQSKVRYEATDGEVWFRYPKVMLGDGGYSFGGDLDFESEYDANRNLTSFRFLFDNSWFEFTVAYNAGNNPVSIEGRDSYGVFTFKAQYEYNNYGHPTLFESYKWDYEKETWVSDSKETAGYDAQGKLLECLYVDDGMEYRMSYEYYDETHFSSKSRTYFFKNEENDGFSHRAEEWKYGADGKLEAYYRYDNDELQYHVIFYYGNSSSVEAVPGNVARVWSSGGQLYIESATSGAAQIYSVAGRLLKTVSFTSGQTTATLLPRDMYIVTAGGRTWKVYVSEL